MASVIDRWQTLSDNVTPHIDKLPGLKDQYTQFQALLTETKALRNQLKVLRANTSDTLAQRNQNLAAGEDLFTRLSLGLQSVHGPKSARLHEFGLKPRKSKSGRPKAQPTTPSPEIPATPPPVELHTASGAGNGPAAAASPAK